jgi:cellulose synthase/poly-beta-1,6-N-acetylglucosamine synthase-like glycosyltransferase
MPIEVRSLADRRKAGPMPIDETLSVIIPAHNEEPYRRYRAKSRGLVTAGIKYEILVVNDKLGHY